MKVTLLCVGKVKEKFYREAIKEYEKRLSAYVKLTTVEIPDEKVKVENSSEIAVAIAEPSIAVSSGLQSGSTDITMLFRVTSLR